MSQQLLYFSGLNARSGRYLTPPLPADEMSAIIQGEERDPQNTLFLKRWYEDYVNPPDKLGVKEGVDATDLAQTGWGVIFAFSDRESTPAIREALSELLDLRRAQANRITQRYREFTGPNAYRPGETSLRFLARHGVGFEAVDPDKGVPYYLLLVGDPEAIPYQFQYQLGVQFAVGRIHFATLDEYASYARSVVLAETGQVGLPRHASFFGVQNPDDRSTELSAGQLVKPVASQLSSSSPDWTVQTVLRDEATKARLTQLVGGDETPALLFTASHGVAFPNGDPRQLDHQGALVCREWPGPEQWTDAIPEDFYLAADDVADDARLLGTMAFLFACYGAGTPRLDDFAHQALGQPTAIAPYAFLARLPRRLLGHPKGGALAVIGHVERTWSNAYLWEGDIPQLGTFTSTLRRLMSRQPLGWSMEFFRNRYAQLATELTFWTEQIKFGHASDDLELTNLWTAHNDARSFIVLGDPAVRLPTVESTDGQPQRPTMEAVTPGRIVGAPTPLSSLVGREPPGVVLQLTLDNPQGPLGLWSVHGFVTPEASALRADTSLPTSLALWVAQLPAGYDRATQTLEQAAAKLSAAETAQESILDRLSAVAQMAAQDLSHPSELPQPEQALVGALRRLAGQDTGVGPVGLPSRSLLAFLVQLEQVLAPDYAIETRQAGRKIDQTVVAGSRPRPTDVALGAGTEQTQLHERVVELVDRSRRLALQAVAIASAGAGQLAPLPALAGQPNNAGLALPLAWQFLVDVYAEVAPPNS